MIEDILTKFKQMFQKNQNKSQSVRSPTMKTATRKKAKAKGSNKQGHSPFSERETPSIESVDREDHIIDIETALKPK